MQTNFSQQQLSNPTIAESEAILRKCVHCGFCISTCPTYALLGNELDSPRGRIYLLKDMLERDAKPTADVVKHIDRCLSCLSCVTTCPSGVDYMHLIDHGRAHIEKTYNRPLNEKMFRWALAQILPYRNRVDIAVRVARQLRSFAPILWKYTKTRPLATMLRMIPDKLATKKKVLTNNSSAYKKRVILLKGCVEPILRPAYAESLKRILTRCDTEVIEVSEEGCCGALSHHLGRTEESLAFARQNIRAWQSELTNGPISAIVTTTSGCGTMLKDYAHLLQNDAELGTIAKKLSTLICDSTEMLDRIDLPNIKFERPINVAYQAPCSLQHGQGITDIAPRLLRQAGFDVKTPKEAHLCCGSAGTYNILQPTIAAQLAERKVSHLEALQPNVIATANIGCALQISSISKIPAVHVVELIDWAHGGPAPAGIQALFPLESSTTLVDFSALSQSPPSAFNRQTGWTE